VPTGQKASELGGSSYQLGPLITSVKAGSDWISGVSVRLHASATPGPHEVGGSQNWHQEALRLGTKMLARDKVNVSESRVENIENHDIL